jgi:hypothetical protein
MLTTLIFMVKCSYCLEYSNAKLLQFSIYLRFYQNRMSSTYKTSNRCWHYTYYVSEGLDLVYFMPTTRLGIANVFITCNHKIYVPSTFFWGFLVFIINEVANLLPVYEVYIYIYKVVTKSFRTGRLEREMQMVQLSLDAVVSLFCESV